MTDAEIELVAEALAALPTDVPSRSGELDEAVPR